MTIEYTPDTIVSAYRSGVIGKREADSIIDGNIMAMISQGDPGLMPIMQAWSGAKKEIEEASRAPKRELPTVSDYLDVMAMRVIVLERAARAIREGGFIPGDLSEDDTAEYSARLSDAIEAWERNDDNATRHDTLTKKVEALAHIDAKPSGSGTRAPASNIGITRWSGGKAKLPIHVRQIMERHGDDFTPGETYDFAVLRNYTTMVYSEKETQELGLPNNASIQQSIEKGNLPFFVMGTNAKGRKAMVYTGEDTTTEDN